MNKGTVRTITLFLIVVAIGLAAAGGLSDMLDKPIILSKQHAWMDASFVLLLAILLNVMV